MGINKSRKETNKSRKQKPKLHTRGKAKVEEPPANVEEETADVTKDRKEKTPKQNQKVVLDEKQTLKKFQFKLFTKSRSTRLLRCNSAMELNTLESK